MSYNIQELPKYINTAGRITVMTALVGVVIFAVAFLLNIGAKEFAQVDAQGIATTSVTVLNTPPQWTVDAQEEFGSSTTTPTNSGDEVAWVAVGTDSNGEDYYLLICENSNMPTSTPGGPPTCNGTTQWAVSGLTLSGTQARAATTTAEAWDESNDWYAWICDSVNPGARCNVSFRQGSGTTSSPFNVNHRPSFTAFSDTSPANPGQVVTFYATSSDPDVVDNDDTMQLIVCSTAGFNTVTNTCDATTLATSTFADSNNMPLVASYTISIPTRDANNYGAFGFVIDEHGHEAINGQQAFNTVLEVNNVAPKIDPDEISLNGGNIINLSQEAGETTGFTLTFTATDDNSCVNLLNEPEINDYEIVIYRSGVGTSTCDTTGANYDPNNCYDSAVATSTWNLQCSLSSVCGGPLEVEQEFSCTFPLWYVADPTSGTSTQTYYHLEDWRASVSAVDDDGLVGDLIETSWPVELNSFLMFSLDTLAIPYGPLEPGQMTDPLVASTTLRATGNVGLDQLISGQSMCDNYTTAVTCPNSSTSTIAERYQVFATSTVSYSTATSSGYKVSSSTPVELEVNILKSTATSSQTVGSTYWGILVPDTITLAGIYTGENTIWGIVGEPSRWYTP